MMTSIWMRENATSFTVYRVHERSKEKLCTLSSKLSHDEIQEARSHLENDFEASKFNGWLDNQRQLIREQYLLKIINQGPDKLMRDVADALALLVDTDPHCHKPKNKQLADDVWRAWNEIWKQVGSTSGWNVKQKDTKKQ